MMIKHSIEIGGHELTLEMGRMAKQAHGSVVVRMGDSIVLATCVGTENADPDKPFFPLTVEYRENYYAAGKFPGGFFKREGKLSTKETLVSRMIDRPLRPMFTDGYMGETQVNASVLSFDGVHDTDVLGMIGAAAATYLSPVPFPQAQASVRVGLIDGEFVVNPTFERRENSKLDLIIAGTKESITMVEAGADFVSESEMVDALDFGHGEIQKLVAFIEGIGAELAIEKWQPAQVDIDQPFYDELEKEFGPRMIEALTTKGKKESEKAVSAVKADVLARFEDDEERAKLAGKYLGSIKESVFREYVLQQRKRTDGRAFDEVRPIAVEVGILPRAHGSALFTRGETQALVSLTLGTKSDSQIVDSIGGESKKLFMLHYNFPSFSVGEVRPNRGPGRREIGHGALAERSLDKVIPTVDEFPYTIRVVSDILESNGSSSMASVCGGSLALADAGVPIHHAVAGVAMGLVKEGDDYAILTDIQGAEDHYGDMDFKVAGSAEGITSLQMDLKVKGLTKEIMAEALDQARRGRLHILDKMNAVLDKPREGFSEHAPKIMVIEVPVDKIRDVIGPGGKVIRSIVEKTGAKIDIEDSGKCFVSAPDAKSGNAAMKMIEDLVAVPEEGKSYLGRITRIVDFGAFVEIIPGTEGLLHISEIANYRVRNVTDELSEGEEVMVKVLSVERNGKIRLSRKALLT